MRRPRCDVGSFLKQRGSSRRPLLLGRQSAESLPLVPLSLQEVGRLWILWFPLLSPLLHLFARESCNGQGQHFGCAGPAKPVLPLCQSIKQPVRVFLIATLWAPQHENTLTFEHKLCALISLWQIFNKIAQNASQLRS